MSPRLSTRLSAGLSPRLLLLVQAVALSLLFEEYDTGILRLNACASGR
jgi:hypothetical protein